MATLYGVHARLFVCGPVLAPKTFDKYVSTVMEFADQLTFSATLDCDTAQTGSNRPVTEEFRV